MKGQTTKDIIRSISSYKVVVNRVNMVLVYVIKISLRHILLPFEYKIIMDLLFQSKYSEEYRTLTNLRNIMSTSTRLRKNFNDNDNVIEETWYIFYKVDDQSELPRFESDLISVYEEHQDRREWKKLLSLHEFKVLGTNVIRLLKVSEYMYIKSQLDRYVEKYEPRGLVTCK